MVIRSTLPVLLWFYRLQGLGKKQLNEDRSNVNEVVSDRTTIGWTSKNHTGANIPVFAYGPQFDKFVGFHDNTDLPKIIAGAMKLK